MDSTVGYDPTLPLDLDGSCNPDLLPEVTFRNHLEFPDGTVPLVGKQNTGRMSPVRAITMKDYDQIISELRKENFNLKLRIYFLEERMQQKFTDGDDIFKTNIELRVAVESLKKELTDKQELLKKASLAMESLTVNHQMELQQVKGHIENKLKEQHSELADKYNQSVLDSSVYQKDLEDAEQRVLALENQLEVVQKELEETKAYQIKDCEKLNDALQTLQDKQSQITKLEDLVRKGDDDLTREKQISDNLERQMEEEVKQMKKYMERKDRDIQNISNLMDNVNSSFNSDSFLAPTHLQDAMEDQKETVKNIQFKLLDRDNKLADKNNMITELEDQIYQLERDNKDLANQIHLTQQQQEIEAENTLKRDKTIQGFILAMYKKEKEVDALKEKLSDTEKQVEKLTEELHQSNLYYKKTTSELTEDNILMADKVTFLENQLQISSEEVEKLLKSLGKSDGESVKFQEMIAKAKDALNNSEEAIEGLQHQLNQEKIDGQSRAEKLQQHYQGLLEDVETQVQNKDSLLTKLTKRLQDKDKQLHDYLGLLNTDNTQQQENGSSPIDLLKKLQHKLKEKESALENLEKEKLNCLEDKESEIRNLKQSLREKDQDLGRANQMLLTAEDNTERLDKEVKLKEEKLDQLSKCLQSAQTSFEEALDNHVRAVEHKSNMINRLQESIDSKEAALQEAVENSPGLATDQVKKLRQQLRAKETTLQELLNEKNDLAVQNEKHSRNFYNKLQVKDREIKSLQEKGLKERSSLDRELQQLQTDINKRDLEIQKLEADGLWTEEQVDKLRESLKEKDKTIEALFESGKEKDKLLQQTRQARSPSVSSSMTDMAHIQALQEEIAFLLNHLKSKDAMINQLRSKSDSSPWQQKEIDRLTEEVIKKNQSLKSSMNSENRLSAELADVRRRVAELESNIQPATQNTQLSDVIKDQMAELKSLGDILKAERQIYVTLNNQNGQQTVGSTDITKQLHQFESLREKLEEGIERNNTLNIILQQQQAKPNSTDETKANKETNTSQVFYDKYCPDTSTNSQTIKVNTSPLKTPLGHAETQTDLTGSTKFGVEKLESCTVRFTDGEPDHSLNLLSKSMIDSVNNSDLLNSQHKFIHFAERPSEFTKLHNQCFSRMSTGYGETRGLDYASSEVSSDSTGLNPQETVLSSNRVHQPIHSPPQLLRKINEESAESVLQSDTKCLNERTRSLFNSEIVRSDSPRKSEHLDDSVFASETLHSSVHSSPHLLRHQTQSSTHSTHPQSITHINSTTNPINSQSSELNPDIRLNSLSDYPELTVPMPEIDIDRLSVDQSVLLSEDISNMPAHSLRKLVTKLQNDLMDSLQENHSLHSQVRDSLGSREVPGKNESDPTTADLQLMQQKIDQLQTVLAKTQNENESLKKHLTSAGNFNEPEGIKDLKEKLLKMQKNNNLLKKQIILNTSTSSSPSGFNPELVIDLANEVERLKKSISESSSRHNLSDSENSENSVTMAQDGSASPKGNRSRGKLVDSAEGDNVICNGQGDVSNEKSPKLLLSLNKDPPKLTRNVGSHIPRLMKTSDTQNSKSTPVIVIHNESNDPLILNSLLQAARSSVKQLEEKLAATENTVRFQSSKMKYYRGLAIDAGLIPKMGSRSQSETNLFQKSKDAQIMATASCENLTDFNDNGSVTTEDSKEYGKTENVTTLKIHIDELINKLQRQTWEINNLKMNSFKRTCRSLSPPNVSPRIKQLKNQLLESVQASSGKDVENRVLQSPSTETKSIPEQDYIQNLKIRFPENEKLRNSADRSYRSPSPQKSLNFSGRKASSKSWSQTDLDSADGVKQNTQLLDHCRQLESELDEMKHDNSILAARLVELDHDNKQHHLPVETLTKQLKALDNEKQKLEINLQKANSRIEEFESEIRSSRFEKLKLEQNLHQCERKLKWVEQNRSMSESDQELFIVRQQLHDSQNSCLQLRNQLEEISFFLTELICQDCGQSESSSNVDVTKLDRIKQHLQYSKDVIDASLSDVSHVEDRSRLDSNNHVTGSKYQSAIDEINKLHKQLKIQETRSHDKLVEKESEISSLRDELVTLSCHGVPEGCDSDSASPHRSQSSDYRTSSGNKSRKSNSYIDKTTTVSDIHPTEENLSVEQMRHRLTSGRTDLRSNSSITGVTNLVSDQDTLAQHSKLNLQRSFHSDSFIGKGDNMNVTFRERGDKQNELSQKGGNFSSLYFSKMDESDFLLSDSHFCNQSNGSMFGGRQGLDHVDSSDTRSKVSDDTLSHTSSYKERSATPTGSEIVTLKSRLSVVEDMNKTLKDEISMYENIVQSGNQRTPRNRSSRDQDDHLAEIRALRLRLEKSLDECEKLQTQLEERLGETQEGENSQYEIKIRELNNFIEDLKSQLSDRENVIKEKLTILDEREKTIHKTKLILQENNKQVRRDYQRFSDLEQRCSVSEQKCLDSERKHSEVERKYLEAERKCSEFERTCIELDQKRSESEKQCSKIEQNHRKMEQHYQKYQQRREKQELQLKKAGKEIRKLQQEMLLWKERAEEKIELNKTLKLELSMYEKLQNSNAGDGNLEVTDLLTEVRHLRIQLERCIDTNNRLRQTMEMLLQQQSKQPHTKLGSPLSSTASDAADGRPSPQNSPRKPDQREIQERETYIHRKTREDRYEFDIVDAKSGARLRVNSRDGLDNSQTRERSRERTFNGVFRDNSQEQGHDYRSGRIYGNDITESFRYKIESSNLNHSLKQPTGRKSLFTTSYPNCCPNPNTSIHSLPSDLNQYFDKERSVKYWVDTATYQEVPHVDVDSDIRRLFAIGKLDDFEKIRKENEEELSVLGGLEARVRDRINTVRKSTEQSVEYSTLKEISMAIENLRICMDAESLVIKRFWISQLPPVNELGEFYDAKLAEDNRLLRKEVAKLKTDNDLVKQSARTAEQRLNHTARQRQGMEDAICQQLTRTNKILQQASDNFRTTNKSGPYYTPSSALYLTDLNDK